MENGLLLWKKEKGQGRQLGNFLDFGEHHVSKISARNVINQNQLTVSHFSVNSTCILYFASSGGRRNENL